MKTKKQRIQLYKAVNRKRDKDIKQHSRTVAAALNGSLEPFFKRLRQAGDYKESYLNLITETGLKFAIRQINITTGFRFAQSTAKGLQQQSTKDLGLTTYELEVEALLKDMTPGGLGSLIIGMNNETRKQIAKDISKYMAQGLPIENMAAFLENHYKDVNRIRGRRIARTETIKASNFGALSGAQASGVPFVKEWNSILDSRTRAGHSSADGKQAKEGDPFRVNGEKLLYPADTSMGASAGNVVNCRCVIDFVDPDEYDTALDTSLGGAQDPNL